MAVQMVFQLPLWLARQLGRITADYRWFALVYIVGMFLVAPLITFLLSWAGTGTLYCVGAPIIALTAFVIVINLLQDSENYSRYLPNILKTWEFLPIWARSLQPYDKLFKSLRCCCMCKDEEEVIHEDKSVVETELSYF